MKYLKFFIAALILFAGCRQDRATDQAAGFSSESGLYGPENMEITLWAESPMFFNPTNMDVDIRGRVWVTEAVNYRDFNNKPDHRLHRDHGERVVILEDTDQDGKADKSTILLAEAATFFAAIEQS